MTDLARKTCVPCRGGVPALTARQIAEYLPEVPGWTVVENHHLVREFEFPDFAQALAATNRVGRIAEEQGHHPDLFLAWGRLGVKIWTHKIDGLTESDFILAAKIDEAV
ncbi:MAG: 4a-hydroxytetrahydrobiopterin dehydratase [Gemmatimonadetes bacterium]|nr:4a-hydroxytetrahydrobiopterin dehydratase [Gemmatimonadota bacterium]